MGSVMEGVEFEETVRTPSLGTTSIRTSVVDDKNLSGVSSVLIDFPPAGVDGGKSSSSGGSALKISATVDENEVKSVLADIVGLRSLCVGENSGNNHVTSECVDSS